MIKLTESQTNTLTEMAMIFKELLGKEFEHMSVSLKPFMQEDTPNVEVTFFDEDHPEVYITYRRIYNTNSPGFQSDCTRCAHSEGRFTYEFYKFITSSKVETKIDIKLRKVRQYLLKCLRENFKFKYGKTKNG